MTLEDERLFAYYHIVGYDFDAGGVCNGTSSTGADDNTGTDDSQGFDSRTQGHGDV